MICFEVSVNGRMLCTAGVGDRAADLAALVCALGGSSEGKGITTSLDVRGAADDVQMTWVEGFDELRPGDVVTVRIVERETADPPATRVDGRTLAMKREDAAGDPGPVCAFCRRGPTAARRLVAGPPAFICHECVAVCTAVLKEDAGRAGAE